MEQPNTMNNIESIFPANNFSHVLENAKGEIECGIIIGYDEDGVMQVYGGGLLDGKQPVCKDWLWLVQTFSKKLLDGDYSG